MFLLSISHALNVPLTRTHHLTGRNLLTLMIFWHSPAADGLTFLHKELIFVTICAVHHLVDVLFINLLQISLIFSLAWVWFCILGTLFRVYLLRRKVSFMLQLIFIHFEIVYEWKRVIKLWLLKRFEAFELRMNFRLDQTWNILWPFDVFQLIIIDKIEIVQLSVV